MLFSLRIYYIINKTENQVLFYILQKKYLRKDFIVTILDKILALIKEKGITQNAFLMDMGLDKSTISDWKRGSNQSYKKHIERIADYFNVSVDYLLGRENMTFAETEEQKQAKSLLECFNELSGEDRAKVLEYAQMLRDRVKE